MLATGLLTIPHAFLFSYITYEAAQMWTLDCFLPFAIVHMIPEKMKIGAIFFAYLKLWTFFFLDKLELMSVDSWNLK